MLETYECYLKGLKWGMSKDPLLSLLRALICPIIKYGMEVYFLFC